MANEYNPINKSIKIWSIPNAAIMKKYSIKMAEPILRKSICFFSLDPFKVVVDILKKFIVIPI